MDLIGVDLFPRPVVRHPDTTTLRADSPQLLALAHAEPALGNKRIVRRLVGRYAVEVAAEQAGRHQADFTLPGIIVPPRLADTTLLCSDGSGEMLRGAPLKHHHRPDDRGEAHWQNAYCSRQRAADRGFLRWRHLSGIITIDRQG